MADFDPNDSFDSNGDLTPEEVEELRRLSPKAVLEKNAAVTPPSFASQPPATAPVAAAPAAPANNFPLPSREELIEQASRVPAAPFAVPGVDQITPIGSQLQPNPITVSSVTPPAPLPPARPAILPTPPTPPTQPLPPAAVPVLNQEILSPEKAAASVRPAVLGETSLERSRSMRMKIGIGALGSLAVTVLLLVIFAFTGSRVPVLYSAFHGISPNGIALADSARSTILAFDSYAGTGEIDVLETGSVTTTKTANDVIPTSPSPSPSVSPSPTSTSTVGTNSATSSLVTKYSQLAFENSEEQMTGNGIFTINRSSSPIAFTLRAPNEGDWTVRASGESTAFDTAPGTSIRKSLLGPALEPMPLGNLLASVSKEVGYSLLKDSTGKYAQYSYSVKSPALAAYLPGGMEVKDNSRLDVWYATSHSGTKTAGIVTASRLRLDVVYAKKSYTITQTLIPSVYGEASVATAKALSEQLLGTASEVPTMATAEGFINAMGLFLSSLPNTLSDSPADGEVVVTPSPTPTASASPTATATATATPSPISTADPTEIQSPIAAVTIPATAPTYGIVSDAMQARNDKRHADLTKISAALELYKTAYGRYPISLSEVQLQADTPIFSALVPSYLTAMPIDPQFRTYYYGYRSDGIWFVLTALSEFTNVTDTTAKQGTNYYYFEVKNP